MTQLARHLDLRPSQCASLIRKLTRQRFVFCLNPHARSSRVYWLTENGLVAQRRVRASEGLAPITYDFPDIDWALYGWVCYRHRAAILRALTEPLQPPAIKRRARSHNPHVRMSCNNIRGVLRLFVAKGIAQPVRLKRKAHRPYELTELGQTLRQLLVQAETVVFVARRCQ